MALYYTGTLRGTIGSQNFAVTTHWRKVGALAGITELQMCQAIAQMLADFWDTSVSPINSTQVNLTKVFVAAYDEPTGLYELAFPSLGEIAGIDACPPFVAKGFRQFRSNADFRTSTHRFPEVLEPNNTFGSWAYSSDVTAPDIAAISTFLGEQHMVDIPDTIESTNVMPVLIRTRYTTVDPITHAKTVNYLTPHEISDVASAGFYGITSQVSRKYVLPT
jgi:hypothetical protein